MFIFTTLGAWLILCSSEMCGDFRAGKLRSSYSHIVLYSSYACIMGFSCSLVYSFLAKKNVFCIYLYFPRSANEENLVDDGSVGVMSMFVLERQMRLAAAWDPWDLTDLETHDFPATWGAESHPQLLFDPHRNGSLVNSPSKDWQSLAVR